MFSYIKRKIQSYIIVYKIQKLLSFDVSHFPLLGTIYSKVLRDDYCNYYDNGKILTQQQIKQIKDIFCLIERIKTESAFNLYDPRIDIDKQLLIDNSP